MDRGRGQNTRGDVTGLLAQDWDGGLHELRARETVLCTGGTGGLFEVTTNPKSAQGDGLAMAARCGALVADAEFVQFHPTAMDVGADPAPLATEALRGEGAVLRNGDGAAFMARYHTDAELAPRDEVARAIHTEREAGRGVFLDARDAVGSAFPDHFPTVFNACLAANIDPRGEMIPVAPAAHYHMGGLVSDLWGRSSLDGLSVCGECASTGVHGANRLASNSLLEAVVFAVRIAERLRDDNLKTKEAGTATAPTVLPTDALTTLRKSMQAHCGVLRSADGLESLGRVLDELIGKHGASNALVAAQLIWSGASARKESRGGHFRTDFPGAGADAKRSFATAPQPHPAELVP